MKRLIVDTDPGIDDAMAILLAVYGAPAVKLEAITTVNGNADIEKVTQNTFTILEVCEAKEVPVYKGAEKPLCREVSWCESSHGDDGLGNLKMKKGEVRTEKETAAEFLVRAARENSGELTLLPIGPLTNIAQAIRMDEHFAKNIKEVVLMGGSETGGNVSPVAEFNFWHDPEAARIVFGAGFSNMVMVGLDVTRKVFLSPAMREYLYQIHTPVSLFLHRMTRVYVDSYWEKIKNLGCELCDVLAVAYVLDERVLELKKALVKIETEGIGRGMSVVYPAERWKEQGTNCLVAAEVDAKRFFQLFLDCLFPEYREETKRMLEDEFR